MSSSVEEVFPGIFRLPIPIPNSPLGNLNAYLIRSNGEVMLIDAGWNTPSALDALDRHLRQLGLGFRQIQRLLITHIHPDHYGLAGKVQEMSGANLLLHRVERAFIESRYQNVDNLLDEMAEWLRVNGVPLEEINVLERSSLDMLALVAPARPDTLLGGGETITVGSFRFEVIWTPGHSAGHICLYDREREILIAGDHVLLSITPNVSLHPQSFSNPLADYLDALEMVEQLPTKLVLPGHREIFHEVGPRAREIRHHHYQRSQEIWDAIGEGEATAYTITSRVRWMGGRVPWTEMAHFHRRLALLEVLAHLERLRSDESVEKIIRGSVVCYARGAERPAAPAQA